jgi:hypothetical protein
MGSHIHWIVWVYRRQDNGSFEDMTTVEVLADTWEEARDKVQCMVPLTIKGGHPKDYKYGTEQGPGYRLSNVIEHLGDVCPHG